MPARRRRPEARRRPWPLFLLFAAGVATGVALWAYAPSLPAETLIARYAGDRSRARETMRRAVELQNAEAKP